ncbi:MAG: 50S ribosomal protein L16 [Nanoarchaeota archaeon]|nr:50S ribosomal protein L16 [Nanoarchaeota archaeon]
MATLRKGICYSRRITRAYTRKSKVKSKAYIRTVPQSRVVRYEMGEAKAKYDHEVNLICRDNCQIRHNAIESVRQIVNRRLNEKVGVKNYFMKLMIFPHHILRENKMLSGAHADRLQTGMQRSFGKSIGFAAQVKKGKVVFSVLVNKEHVNNAIEAAKLANPRLPGKYSVEVKKFG